MGLPISLSDDDRILVADASTIINLNATGCAPEILRALPYRVAAVNVVVDELENGLEKGRSDGTKLKELVAANLIDVVALNQQGMIHFESLVIGAASDTLDDGEAATIAYAADAGFRALIDERKATRICAMRFPEVRLGSTVDIFAHTNVQHALGQPRLSDGVLKALLHARMRVLPHYIEWIVDLIGPEQAAQCLSLPNSVRTRASKRSTR